MNYNAKPSKTSRNLIENSPLISRIYSKAKDTLKNTFVYTPVLIGSLFLPSYLPAQTREVSFQETFTSEGSLTKPDIREPLANWNINDKTQKLEMDNLLGTYGPLDYNFNDATFNFGTLEGRIELTFSASKWIGGVTKYGIAIARDPIGNTLYEFGINAHPDAVGGNQFGVIYKTPKLGS